MKKTIFPAFLWILLCAGVLFCLSRSLEGVRQTRVQEVLLEKMRILLPGSTHFTSRTDENLGGSVIAAWEGETGVVVQTVTGGYAGDITMLVGIGNSGRVTGVQVCNMAETWGLGSRILTDSTFLAQFLNTSGQAVIGVDADALSGATVSSRAVARGIREAVAYVTGADASSGATLWGG